MKIIIRSFFRALRLVMTPVMLISEKLSTPKAIVRTPEEQLAVDRTGRTLALYQFRACPFCIKVRKEMARLGVTVETRDAQHDAGHRAALEAGGGKVKVPCLLIRHDDGQQEWLYESDAIKAWLQDRFETPSAA
jgi:glutaredoxin